MRLAWCLLALRYEPTRLETTAYPARRRTSPSLLHSWGNSSCHRVIAVDQLVVLEAFQASLRSRSGSRRRGLRDPWRMRSLSCSLPGEVCFVSLHHRGMPSTSYHRVIVAEQGKCISNGRVSASSMCMCMCMRMLFGCADKAQLSLQRRMHVRGGACFERGGSGQNARKLFHTPSTNAASQTPILTWYRTTMPTLQKLCGSGEAAASPQCLGAAGRSAQGRRYLTALLFGACSLSRRTSSPPHYGEAGNDWMPFVFDVSSVPHQDAIVIPPCQTYVFLPVTRYQLR